MEAAQNKCYAPSFGIRHLSQWILEPEEIQYSLQRCQEDDLEIKMSGTTGTMEQKDDPKNPFFCFLISLVLKI